MIKLTKLHEVIRSCPNALQSLDSTQKNILSFMVSRGVRIIMFWHSPQNDSTLENASTTAMIKNSG